MSSEVEVFFFPNGNTAVFRDGEQVPELQQSWLLMFAKFLEGQGVNPLEAKINLPGGPIAKLFKIDSGNSYNWTIERAPAGGIR